MTSKLRGDELPEPISNIEHALQVVGAMLARDEETVKRVIDENPLIGTALISLNCSLAEQLAIHLGITAGELIDMMLLLANSAGIEHD